MSPIVEYVVNYDYISKVLCVNKEKPQMQCNGKCHLMQELAKAADDEKPISDKKITVKEFEILFYQEVKIIAFSVATFSQKHQLNSNYSNLYSHLVITATFHPPSYFI
ncbi:hypothetical protein [Flavobacterium sp. 25HG05S-40]|uniref:hypothetical protein n=1 Tax=Flavobacterium sp. 25HG05S-40 TaxID=3458682 RepID=UPI0040441EBF